MDKIEITLSRDADLLIRKIYVEYRKRIENGMSKSDAKLFRDVNGFRESYFPEMDDVDFVSTLSELKRTLKIKIYINASFLLSDEAVIYMENRFKNKINQAADFLGKIKNIIPF